MNTPAMPDWNDDPDLKAFLKTLENYAEISGEQSRSNVCSKDSQHNFLRIKALC